jgi:hypothetical protein
MLSCSNTHLSPCLKTARVHCPFQQLQRRMPFHAGDDLAVQHACAPGRPARACYEEDTQFAVEPHVGQRLPGLVADAQQVRCDGGIALLWGAPASASNSAAHFHSYFISWVSNPLFLLPRGISCQQENLSAPQCAGAALQQLRCKACAGTHRGGLSPALDVLQQAPKDT